LDYSFKQSASDDSKAKEEDHQPTPAQKNQSQASLFIIT
jgi:hypothetical protein